MHSTEVLTFFCFVSTCLPYVISSCRCIKYPSPPTLTAQPPHKILYSNADTLDHPVLLECDAEAIPTPEYRWLKNGLDFDYTAYEERITQSIGKGTLAFKKFEITDEGQYQCSASNKFGKAVTNIVSLRIGAAPYWIKSSNNTIAAEGEVVRFVCDAAGLPEPELQWLVNGEPLQKATVNPRRKVEGNTVIIEAVEQSDTAVYQCNASNIHGYIFKNFYLTVMDLPPKLLDGPNSLTRIIESSDVTLVCRAFGSPKPTVIWLKDGQKLDGERFQVSDDGDLKISNALKTATGEYTCRVSNKHGNVEDHGTLEVKSKTVITEHMENVETTTGRRVVLRCNAEADPSLTLDIKWKFNGKFIDFDQEEIMIQGTDYSLGISKATLSLSGVYTCAAKTEIDEVESNTTLIVQDIPEPPSIISNECDELHSLISWKPMGDGGARILSYTVEYSLEDNPGSWTAYRDYIPASQTKYTADLSPSGAYRFRIIARNKVGPSYPSDSSSLCQTHQFEPYKHPDYVRGEGTGPDNIVISWVPMPPVEHNAPGFFYKVFWKRDNTDDWNTEIVTDWRQNQLVISNQPTFANYRIKVEAHNKFGIAPVKAEEIIGHSGEGVPLEAPANFRIVTLSQEDFEDDEKNMISTFAWDPVDPDSLRGRFIGYKIQYWVSDNTEYTNEVIVPKDVTQQTVLFRKINSKYTARVCAVNSVYNGPPSNVVEFSSPEGTPGPVSYLEAVPNGYNEISLAWKVPMQPNGIITGYTIVHKEVDGTALSEESEKLHVGPDNNATTIGGLKPNTRYRVTIRAATKAGEGSPYFVELKTNKFVDH